VRTEGELEKRKGEEEERGEEKTKRDTGGEK
jgi:hypothetical protein